MRVSLKYFLLIIYSLSGVCFVGYFIVQHYVLAYFKTPEIGSDLIPNMVHYILVNDNTINFIAYLSILSVIKIQKPDVIYLHTNIAKLNGYYWNQLQSFAPILQLNNYTPPTHVYGQPLTSIYHISDVSRIDVLRKFGGIYLDTDMFILNNLNSLRIYNCVVGWPEGQAIGSQLLMARNTSKFLRLWQEGYKKYRSRDWYYNAGRYPAEILKKNKELAHSEPILFGVQYLLDKLLSMEPWNEWKRFYGIHILSRHNDFMNRLNESSVYLSTTNFAKIAQWILSLK